MTAIKQEQDIPRNVEQVGLTTRQPKTTCEEMLNTIGDSLSYYASSNAREDGEDVHNDKEDAALGKLNEHKKSGCVMGTISNTVHH